MFTRVCGLEAHRSNRPFRVRGECGVAGDGQAEEDPRRWAGQRFLNRGPIPRDGAGPDNSSERRLRDAPPAPSICYTRTVALSRTFPLGRHRTARRPIIGLERAEFETLSSRVARGGEIPSIFAASGASGDLSSYAAGPRG